jgi:hypothetical protein|tara:strand:+ start:379 stop:633 length:255 start_codon:yes stop_codon:yes gene_type:complete
MPMKKSQKSLKKWTKEDWGTKSGKPSTQGKKATGERYLPKKAREALSSKEYAATTAKKRKDTKAGKQHSKQPAKTAKKTARHRK